MSPARRITRDAACDCLFPALTPHAAARSRSAFDHDLACEEAAGALMRHYTAAGRRELAARVYRRCTKALADLGLRASPFLDDLYADVMLGPATLAP